jgi:hypothetical protein
MRKYLFIFALAALVLAACRAESNIVIDIEEDGSATISAEIGFDEEMLDLLSQTGDDPAELFTEELLPESEGFESYSRAAGDMTYYGISGAVGDLENDALLILGQEFVSDFAAFSYTTDGDVATLEASIVSADIGGGLGDLPIDPTDITGDIFSANLIVSMPGTVIEHNADEVRDDGSLVWNIPLTGAIDVVAVSDVGSGSSAWIWWVIIGVLAIGVIAGIAAVMVSRNDSKKAVAEASAAHAASSTDPSPPAVQAPPALEASGEPDTPALEPSDDADKPALGAADEKPALEAGDSPEATDGSSEDSPEDESSSGD